SGVVLRLDAEQGTQVERRALHGLDHHAAAGRAARERTHQPRGVEPLVLVAALPLVLGGVALEEGQQRARERDPCVARGSHPAAASANSEVSSAPRRARSATGVGSPAACCSGSSSSTEPSRRRRPWRSSHVSTAASAPAKRLKVGTPRSAASRVIVPPAPSTRS